MRTQEQSLGEVSVHRGARAVKCQWNREHSHVSQVSHICVSKHCLLTSSKKNFFPYTTTEKCKNSRAFPWFFQTRWIPREFWVFPVGWYSALVIDNITLCLFNRRNGKRRFNHNRHWAKWKISVKTKCIPTTTEWKLKHVPHLWQNYCSTWAI